MPDTLTPDTAAPGYIVLAAYRPDPVLFERQVRSIQAQTVQGFRCLVVADGGEDEVRALLAEIVADDERFTVIGADVRVGFYRNFERGLAMVPTDAAWVALSDQDDDWHPDKLERMLPFLSSASLVGAQARVVEYPSGLVLSDSTDRRPTTPVALAVCNQFTGGMTVMRAELLRRALPFPHYPSPAQVHDHWLALVAACEDGAMIITDVVQDYVQHGANVLGEAGDRTGVKHAARNLRSRAQTFSPRTGVGALAAAAYVVSAGWAEVMANTLAERFGAHHTTAERLSALFGSRRSLWRTASVLVRGVRLKCIPARNVVVYLVGAALRPLVRR